VKTFLNFYSPTVTIKQSREVETNQATPKTFFCVIKLFPFEKKHLLLFQLFPVKVFQISLPEHARSLSI